MSRLLKSFSTTTCCWSQGCRPTASILNAILYNPAKLWRTQRVVEQFDPWPDFSYEWILSSRIRRTCHLALLPHQVWNTIGGLRQPSWALMFHCIVMLREPERWARTSISTWWYASLSRTDKSVMIKCPMRSCRMPTSSFPFRGWKLEVCRVFSLIISFNATRNWNTRGLVLWVSCYHVPVRMELDSRRRSFNHCPHQVHLNSVGYEPFKDGTTDCDWRMDNERIRKLEFFAWRIRWPTYGVGLGVFQWEPQMSVSKKTGMARTWWLYCRVLFILNCLEHGRLSCRLIFWFGCIASRNTPYFYITWSFGILLLPWRRGHHFDRLILGFLQYSDVPAFRLAQHVRAVLCSTVSLLIHLLWTALGLHS